MVALPKPETKRYSIGQVVELLVGDFPDLSLSKVRYLEDQGLVTPERTSSGYRKYTQAHIERLRMILILQRDQFMPLKKISEALAELDAGKDSAVTGRINKTPASMLQSVQKKTRVELAQAAEVKVAFIAEAISAGMLPSVELFGPESLRQVLALKQLAQRGLTPRHLRWLRLAAEKEAEMIKQAAGARFGKMSGPEYADESLALAELFEAVSAGVVRQSLRRKS